MRRFAILLTACTLCILFSHAQNPIQSAGQFISSLDSIQKAKALYPFDIDERYNFHFFPKEDRKGIPLNDLNKRQRDYAFNLLKTSLSEATVQKVRQITQLEKVLKELEHRNTDDHYRDTGKYYITIFGLPGLHTIWGWRFEGHHVSFTFTASNNKLVSGTPGFLGANPAIVQEGPQKGEQVLKDEETMGFDLLRTLSAAQEKKTLITTNAPGEIITFVSRRAMIEHPSGIRYSELSDTQKQQLLQLIRLYVHRYTKLLADAMLKEIQEAGFKDIRFAWAGDMQIGIGHPHYYRIQGPTFIIEYDNTQNNANHVHTVIRDLKNDFGGDLLLEHYRTSH